MEIKAVIFDCDGTILDTIGDLNLTMNKILSANGFPILPKERVRALIGNGAREYMRLALPEAFRDDATVDKYLLIYSKNYIEQANLQTRVYAGIKHLLDALHNAGILCAVLSNKPHDATIEVVTKFFPNEFDLIFGQKPQFPPKPDKQSAYELMKQLGVSHENTLMVGDGDADYLVAKNAELHYAGALWGYRTRQELEDVGADGPFFETPLQLEQAILINGKK